MEAFIQRQAPDSKEAGVDTVLVREDIKDVSVCGITSWDHLNAPPGSWVALSLPS